MKDGQKKIVCSDNDISTIISIYTDKILENIPKKFNPEIMEYLVKLCIDYVDHSQYIEKLYSIINSNSEISFFTGNPEISSINFCTVNMNYFLGAPIDKIKCRDVFLKHKQFVVEYDPTVDKHLTLRVNFTIDDLPPHIKNNVHVGKGISYHTFIIYKSGEVTQSGPHIDLMVDIYNQFRYIVHTEGHLFFTPCDPSIKKKEKIIETDEIKINRSNLRKERRYRLIESYYQSQNN